MWSYLLTEEQLQENRYPRPTSNEGVAFINLEGEVTAGETQSRVSGYVSTSPWPETGPSSSSCKPRPQAESVYALDCEMCYTTKGLQLARVSVVDMHLKPVYEKLVKPSCPIVDYNTR